MITNLKAKIGYFRFEIRKYCLGVLFVTSAVLMGLGLLHSYSRGAWCATACGISYLAWRKLRSSKFKIQSEFGWRISRLKNLPAPFSLSRFLIFRLSIAVILASVVILCFWQFRGTAWHPARRALSVAKMEDFSWRNRVAAWKGALQITADRPWLGTGWKQPEPMYQNYYILPKLAEFEAIEMNDYLMLGATLGVPALVCFGMYVWLTLGGRGEREERGAGSGECGE